MKQLFLLFTVTLSLSLNAQIAFDHLAPPYPFVKFTTSDLGEKYAITSVNQTDHDSLIIYNSDWSLYRTVVLPQGLRYSQSYGLLGGGYLQSLSDKLFNSDSLIEFVTNDNQAPWAYTTYHIVNELGQIQYTFPDTGYAAGIALYKIGNTFKLTYTSKNLGGMVIYSLPGSLPCNQCNFSTGLVEPSNGGNEMAGLNAYPNPFNNTLTLEYKLLSKENAHLQLTGVDGREFKNLSLNNSSDKIILSTSDLPKGVIIATLYGNNERVISKKLLKIE